MDNVRKKISKRFIYILIVFVVIAFAVSFSLLRLHAYTHFSVDKWNAYSWNDRQVLIKSFLKHYDLSQMTKSEILNLLGNDTAYNLDYSIRNKTSDNLVYDFGLQRFTSASNLSLVISFDENEHVSKYELMRYSQ